MRKNNSDNYEVAFTLRFDHLFAEKFPIAYQAKKEELMEDCGMSESEAVAAMKDMVVELEIYYEKGRGLFAVESEAVESTNIYSPYTKEELTEADTLAEDAGNGRVRLKLPDGDTVYLRETFDIVDIAEEHYSVLIEDEEGGIITSIDDMRLPEAEDIDEAFVAVIEEELSHF